MILIAELMTAGGGELYKTVATRSGGGVLMLIFSGLFIVIVPSLGAKNLPRAQSAFQENELPASVRCSPSHTLSGLSVACNVLVLVPPTTSAGCGLPDRFNISSPEENNTPLPCLRLGPRKVCVRS